MDNWHILPDICVDCGDAGGKFATGFSDTSTKLAACVNLCRQLSAAGVNDTDGHQGLQTFSKKNSIDKCNLLPKYNFKKILKKHYV
jgi:hypothetical protein